ncbi:unnamed protein product [Amoebophrya sp. A120]|nr:unnamed protein product [Amoebophrya sp. A120]|eukprot:GSA120T00003216001.1
MTAATSSSARGGSKGVSPRRGGGTPRSQGAGGGAAKGTADDKKASKAAAGQALTTPTSTPRSPTANNRGSGWDRLTSDSSTATSPLESALEMLKHPAVLIVLVVVLVVFGPSQPLTPEAQDRMVKAIVEEQNSGKFASTEDVQILEKNLHSEMDKRATTEEVQTLKDNLQDDLRAVLDTRVAEVTAASTETFTQFSDTWGSSLSNVTENVESLTSRVTSQQESSAKQSGLLTELQDTITNLQTEVQQLREKLAEVPALVTTSHEGAGAKTSRPAVGEHSEPSPATCGVISSNTAVARLNWASRSLGAAIKNASPARGVGTWHKPLNLVGQFVLPQETLAKMTLRTSKTADELLLPTPPIPGEAFSTKLPGFVHVSLGLPLSRVTKVGLRHLIPALTPNPKSAPREFSVQAVSQNKTENELETHQKKFNFVFQETLGLQVFDVQFPSPVKELRFDFHSSWGTDYVTLFRLEVYGEV